WTLSKSKKRSSITSLSKLVPRRLCPGSLVVEATSHPSLFAFSEILAVPNVLQLEGTEASVNLDVLRLFSQGTWSDYKSDASRLPHLVPDQVLKLKQLTVLPYDQLMQELDVINVRELEDFLINECMYAVQSIRYGYALMPPIHLDTCRIQIWSIPLTFL
ncbi:Proteasome component domain protein, partial [Prunus dulcis]